MRKIIEVLSWISQAARLLLSYGVTRHVPDSTGPGGSIFRAIRYWNCRGIFAKCGVRVNVEAGAYIGCGKDISIGDCSGIGINAWIGRGTAVGSHVMMGPDVMILSRNHQSSSRNHQSSRIDIPMTEQGMAPYMPVTIVDDVWIGARAILLPAVTVHSHSIVGAGSVVTRDVPNGVVVAGNPARIVRDRIASSAAVNSGNSCQ